MSQVMEAVKLAADAVEKIKNDGVQQFPIAANIGDAVRQGDIYIQLISPFVGTPEFFVKVASPVFPFQLAPGNTKGSRHCLEESAGIELYVPETATILENESQDFDVGIRQALRQKISEYSKALASAQAVERKPAELPHAFEIDADIINVLNFSGPIFVLKNATTVSHPEHGDWVLPAGTYRCVFQRTVDVERNSIRRVLD